jgi:hypothetical protein
LDSAAPDARPARVFRRHEAKERHQLPGMIEASDVAHFDDQTDRGDE